MAVEVRTLQFPEWDTGKRRLRYLYLCPPCSFLLSHGCHSQDKTIPLFLGADVVSQTGIRIENHPKIHAKFAKKGLATRLNFSSDFRFERLRLPGGLNSLWFYSVQGLFKLAFDMYSKDEQLAVMESLQELWKLHLEDEPLSKSYDLNNILGGSADAMSSFVQSVDPVCGTQLSGHSFREVHDTHRIPQSLAVEHNYCMTEKDGAGTSHPQDAMASDALIHRLQSLLRTCSEAAVDLSAQLQKTAVSLVDVLEKMLSGHTFFDRLVSSIVQLLETASHLQKEGTQCQGASVYENRLLLEVSGWLGARFHSENERISQQVEEFKRKHIERISDLPPAEELVSALFPNAMKVLLLKWMGLCDDADLSKLHSEYPILLLILEFANRNLITGVAHVLYSTLICK